MKEHSKLIPFMNTCKSKIYRINYKYENKNLRTEMNFNITKQQGKIAIHLESP